MRDHLSGWISWLAFLSLGILIIYTINVQQWKPPLMLLDSVSSCALYTVHDQIDHRTPETLMLLYQTDTVQLAEE